MSEQRPVYGAGTPLNGKQGGKHVALDRQRKAIDLRRAGASYDQIATVLGYASRSGSYKAVRAALRSEVHESVAELRALQGERLDTALRAVWPRVVLGDDHAIRSMLFIEKRRAALFGLDAPRRQEVTGRDGGPLQIQPAPSYDYSRLTDDELEHLAALAERISTDGATDR